MDISNGYLMIPTEYLAIPCILGGIGSLNIVIYLICAVVRITIYAFSHNKYHLAKAKEYINWIKGLLLFNLISSLNENKDDEYYIIIQIISVILSASFWIFVISIIASYF